MRPNWKKLAKEAYAKGYAEGVKHSLEWTPASDPPKKEGEYLVLRANLSGGINHPEVRRTTWEYDPSGGGWNEKWMIGSQLVTHWRELPPVPADVKIDVSVSTEWEER